MDHYVTGGTIKRLREGMRMTQAQLAEQLNVSDKTISKWETCKGLPDISEAVPIAEAFRFASPNCRWQGEKSREYFVYFKLF